MNTTFQSRNLKGNVHFSDVNVDGIKADFGEEDCGGVDWNQVTRVAIQ
jgi:hypothetical protein